MQTRVLILLQKFLNLNTKNISEQKSQLLGWGEEHDLTCCIHESVKYLNPILILEREI